MNVLGVKELEVVTPPPETPLRRVLNFTFRSEGSLLGDLHETDIGTTISDRETSDPVFKLGEDPVNRKETRCRCLISGLGE